MSFLKILITCLIVISIVRLIISRSILDYIIPKINNNIKIINSISFPRKFIVKIFKKVKTKYILYKIYNRTYFPLLKGKYKDDYILDLVDNVLNKSWATLIIKSFLSFYSFLAILVSSFVYIILNKNDIVVRFDFISELQAIDLSSFISKIIQVDKIDLLKSGISIVSIFIIAVLFFTANKNKKMMKEALFEAEKLRRVNVITKLNEYSLEIIDVILTVTDNLNSLLDGSKSWNRINNQRFELLCDQMIKKNFYVVAECYADSFEFRKSEFQIKEPYSEPFYGFVGQEDITNLNKICDLISWLSKLDSYNIFLNTKTANSILMSYKFVGYDLDKIFFTKKGIEKIWNEWKVKEHKCLKYDTKSISDSDVEIIKDFLNEERNRFRTYLINNMINAFELLYILIQLQEFIEKNKKYSYRYKYNLKDDLFKSFT